MHALTAALAGAMLLLALRIAPVRAREPAELGVGGHGHGARGGQRAGVGGASRLPIPTPQEIDALRQLLRILASLAGASTSQMSDESAPFLAPPPPSAARRSMPPARAARRAAAAASPAAGPDELAA